jgi:hypothetical protein
MPGLWTVTTMGVFAGARTLSYDRAAASVDQALILFGFGVPQLGQVPCATVS